MKETILALLGSTISSSWTTVVAKFIESSNTILLSDEPGIYTVKNLRAELSVRSKTLKDADIDSVGMVELRNTIETLEDDQVIQNYIFQGGRQTCIVYLDEANKKVIGAILVKKAKGS